jgi:antitoxin component YwqK of YwqJK toxin-antitoxin module
MSNSNQKISSFRVNIDDTDIEYIAGNPTRVLEGEPFTGITFEIIDGQLVEEVTYLNGVEYGMSKSWYPNGNIESEGELKWNLHHGPFKTWHENGLLRSEGVFELGHTIWRKTWDESGNLASEYNIENNPDRLSGLDAIRTHFERRGLLAPM